MQYIEFGKDKDKVSEIVMGLMRISEMSTGEVLDLIETGLEEGINFLDLADIYGGGKSEEVIGKVFTENPSLRKFFVQSKCGIRCDPDFTYFDFSRDYILEAVDGILSRLHTDHLDSLLLHRPDALMEPDEIAEAFDRLYKAGKVRNFGVSNMTTPMMMEMLNREIQFPICANQIQLSCAVTQVFDAGFHMDMQCDKGNMQRWRLLEYCRMKKIPVGA